MFDQRQPVTTNILPISTKVTILPSTWSEHLCLRVLDCLWQVKRILKQQTTQHKYERCWRDLPLFRLLSLERQTKALAKSVICNSIVLFRDCSTKMNQRPTPTPQLARMQSLRSKWRSLWPCRERKIRPVESTSQGFRVGTGTVDLKPPALVGYPVKYLVGRW